MPSTILSRTTRQTTRSARHDARRTLWTESRDKRRRSCGRNIVNNGTGVTVRASGSGSERRGGFAGLQSCGSVWSCPVCSEKINAERQSDLCAGLESWAADGGTLGFLTLTMRHRKGQSLKTLWKALAAAWASVTSGRQWKAEKSLYGIEGYTRVVEVTKGANGWHVHVHALLFMYDDRWIDQAEMLEGGVYARWARSLERHGLTAIRSVGADLRPVTATSSEWSELMASYVTKNNYAAAAFEVTGSHAKKGRGGNRTPFQILADVVRLGDADDLDDWHEWERVSKGKRQLTWSKGLRKMLRLIEVEKTDDQIVAEDLKGDDIAYIPADLWKELVSIGWSVAILEMAEIDDGGKTLREWLDPLLA